MQKLFTLIRQGNIEEVKKIISNKPQLLGSVSGPKPKKDHGQSLLQVALKTGEYDIVDFLIDSGIDINFIETEDDDPGVRAPVLFDAITATIMSLCISEYRDSVYVAERFKDSDRALEIMNRMILLGADVNKRTSNGMSAINWALHQAENVMDRPSVYPFSQEKVRKQLTIILDRLLENGADIKEWLSEGYYPEPCPGESVRDTFWCELEAGENYNERYMSMREFLHKYLKGKNC